MRWLIMAAIAVWAAIAAVVVAAIVWGLLTAGGPQPDQQQQRFAQWEQCELNSNGSGGAGDPCGPMPVP